MKIISLSISLILTLYCDRGESLLPISCYFCIFPKPTRTPTKEEMNALENVDSKRIFKTSSFAGRNDGTLEEELDALTCKQKNDEFDEDNHALVVKDKENNTIDGLCITAVIKDSENVYTIRAGGDKEDMEDCCEGVARLSMYMFYGKNITSNKITCDRCESHKCNGKVNGVTSLQIPFFNYFKILVVLYFTLWRH